MEVRSQFADRYKKDMSIENLRAKIARRNSLTQKENRHKEFKKSRGLALADANVSLAKVQDLTTVEEVNESCVEKMAINKPAPAKAKVEVSAARRTMLQRYKEEQQLRKLKEQREKASKGVFKCGIYKPEGIFAPPIQQAAKVKQKEKPAPPVVTRVTRSSAKAEGPPAQSRTSQMPVSNRIIPKGRGQTNALKKNEKENKVTAVPVKTTKVTAPAPSRLPAVSKGQVRVPAVSKPQKVVPKKPEQKVSVVKPEPVVTNKPRNTMPETVIKVMSECETKVTSVCETTSETPSSVPPERKPSFAPENFEFKPLDGLSTYTFQPMTPNRANAFLTPSFTWSPVGKSKFVFSRAQENETNEIQNVSPPVLTVKTPVDDQVMEMDVPETKECDIGTALPVPVMTPPSEVDTQASPEPRGDGNPEVSAANPPDNELAPSPFKQDVDMTDSLESRDVHGTLPVGIGAPSVDEVMRSPIKNEINNHVFQEAKDDALPVVETLTSEQTSSLPVEISVQPETTLHDVPYFRGLLKSEIQRLTLLCSDWDKRIEMEIPEDAKDLVRTTVGQTRLLLTERFKQFEGLVDNCEFKQGEKETTCTDLDGFWDMIYFQIEDVSKKFVNLEKFEANSWQQTTVQVKKVVRKKPAPTATVNKNLGENGRAAARSRLAAIKAALRNQMKQEEVIAETAVPEPPVPINPVVFDAGFFRIESPAKLPGLRTRHTSQSSVTPKSTKKVLNDSDNQQPSCSEERAPRSPNMVTSPVRKSLFSTDEESENGPKSHSDHAGSETILDSGTSPKHTEPENHPEHSETDTEHMVPETPAEHMAPENHPEHSETHAEHMEPENHPEHSETDPEHILPENHPEHSETHPEHMVPETHAEQMEPENYPEHSGTECMEPENYPEHSGTECMEPENHPERSGTELKHMEPENHPERSETHAEHMEPENHPEHSETHAEHMEPENHPERSVTEPEHKVPENYPEHIEPENHPEHSGTECMEPENHPEHLETNHEHMESENHPENSGTDPEHTQPETVMQVVDISAYLVSNVRLSESMAESPSCCANFSLETSRTALEEETFNFGGTSTVDDVFMGSPEKVPETRSPPPRVLTPEILPDEGVKTVNNPLDFLGSCTPTMVNRTCLQAEYVAALSDLIVFSPMEK